MLKKNSIEDAIKFKIMKHLLTISLIFFVISVNAQDNLSLADAIKTGLENNYQIQIAQKRIDAAKINNTIAATGAYPRITGNINSNNSFFVSSNPASPVLNGKQVGGLGITPSIDLAWTLFDNFKVKINKQRLQQLEEQTFGNSDLIIENSLNAIILGYFRAVIEQEKINVFRQVLTLSKDRYEFEIEKRKLGTGSTFDVVQVKDAYWSDSTNLLRQKNAYKAAIRNLNLALGEEETTTDYALTDTLQFAPQVFNLETLRQKMVGSNRTLRNQILNQRLLQTNTALQNSNQWYIPTVTLNSGINQDLTYSQDFTPDIGIGDFTGGGGQFNFYLRFAVSFNLYDAGATKRAIQNALIDEKIGELNMADQTRTLSNQLGNQLALYNDQVQIISLNDETIANAQRNLTISDERYKRGLINSFDYRNIQLAYLRSAVTRLESIYSLKVIETELTRLTGGLVSE